MNGNFIAKAADRLLTAIDNAVNPDAQAKATTAPPQSKREPMPGMTAQSLGESILPRKPEPKKVDIHVAYQIVTENVPGGPTPAELKEILELKRRWQMTWNDANKNFTISAARMKYQEIHQNEFNRFYESNDTLEHFKPTTEAELQTMYAAKMQMAKEKLKKIEIESLKLCGPIRQRALDSFTAHLSELEANERGESHSLGVAYHPSARVFILHNLVDRLTQGAQSMMPAGPREILPFIRYS